MKFSGIKMSQYLPKPYKPFAFNVKVDLSNYATNADLKNVTEIDTFKLAAKSDLDSLKAEVDIYKLIPLHVDLRKLSDIVKNDVAKKTVYDKLFAKVNNNDTSKFALKTKFVLSMTQINQN